jgi:hypothetical protein
MQPPTLPGTTFCLNTKMDRLRSAFCHLLICNIGPMTKFDISIHVNSAHHKARVSEDNSVRSKAIHSGSHLNNESKRV